MARQYVCEWTADTQHKSYEGLHMLSFSNDGRWLACASKKYISVLHAESGKRRFWVGHPMMVSHISWVGQGLICGYKDGLIAHFQLSRKVLISCAMKEGHHITHLASSSNGRLLASGNSLGVFIWQWDLRHGQWNPTNTTIIPDTSSGSGEYVQNITGMVWIKSEYLAIAVNQHGVQLWNPVHNMLVRYIVAGGIVLGNIHHCNTSGNLIVVQLSKYEVYNINSGSLVASFQHMYHACKPCAILVHDGTVVLGTFRDSKIEGWPTEKNSKNRIFALRDSYAGKKVRSLAYHDHAVEDRLVIATATDDYVQLWINKGQPAPGFRMGLQKLGVIVLLILAMYLARFDMRWYDRASVSSD